MARHNFRGGRERPPLPPFNPQPAKVFKFKIEKILGSLYLIKPLLEKMDIQAIVDSIVPNRKENGQILTTGEVTEILVANRLHYPLPLRDIELWADLCGIDKLFAVESNNLNDDRLARALDDLNEYYEEIMTALALHVIQEFDLKPEEVLWDTTSIYFEGDYDEAEIVKFGYGDKSDLKQIKLALNIDKNSGVPLRGDVVPGNLNDPTIVLKNLKKLRQQLNKKELLFTGDNAMGTVPNCLLLHHNKFHFVAPCPASSLFEQAISSVTPEELDECVFLDKDGTPKFKVTERGVYIDSVDRKKKEELKDVSPFWARCLIIWSKSKAKLEWERREKYMLQIEKRLTDIALTKLNIRRYKNKEYAQNQVDKCFQGPKSYLREIFANPTVKEKDGLLELVYTIDAKSLADLEKRDGLYPVVTNVYDHEKYSTQELFKITRKKYSVEQPMRYLKSKIKVRPVFLHIEERIKGLTLVTFIALMAYCILEHLAKQNINTKATTHQLMKMFASIIFTEGQMLDGTYFNTVVNVKEQHIHLINKLGLAIGSYGVLSKIQLE